MTECERFIREGLFSKEFFKEETKCNFVVTTERKKLWAVLLDMLIQFDKVCKKHNLRYFLIGGSLLGAIRHQGFIPWDDDIDIIMPRSDYQEFIKHSDDFSAPYFLQNCKTDKDFFFVHSRLRNNNTTAIQRPFAERDFNHGAFLDILYYDDFDSEDEGRQAFSELETLVRKISTYMKLTNPFPNNRDKERIDAYDGENPNDLFNRIQELSQSFNNKDMNHIVSTSGLVYGFDRSCFLKEDFDNQILVDFEGFKFPIPIGWERILTITYGDYNKFPAVISRGSWHGSIYFDMDKSYTDTKQEPEYYEWLRKDY